MLWNDVLEVLLALIAFFTAVVFHEYAHGRVASWLGDPTARDAGRLTLNPLAHIDTFGTILLPLLLALLRFTGANVPILGYARPVPINPLYFRHPYQGMMLVALAGPLCNLILAGIGTGLWHALGEVIVPQGFVLARNLFGALKIFLLWFVVVNVVLAVFNLIPVPPLDGSRVLLYLLPEGGKRALHMLEPFGFILIFALLYLGVLERVIMPIVKWVHSLLGVSLA